jgi:hypothetical protein
MNPIQPTGKTPEENSFVTRMAQQMMQTPPEDLIGSPTPTQEYNFDAFKIAGFNDESRRFIKPEDKMKAFTIVLRG